MVPKSDRTIPTADRTEALYSLLRNAARDRLVAPGGQPFAFRTHRGKIRKDNQDTALVLIGRRATSPQPFLAAILCDGMGGLEAGDDAADLAAASVGAMLARDDELAPGERMAQAIRTANAAVFERFHGRAGAVLVAALVEGNDTLIGWLGDARIYGVLHGGALRLLTRDDTVATEIERIDGTAPDAMNALLRAVGTKPNAEPHVEYLEADFRELLLVSDGVHRIEREAFDWVLRHAQTSTEMVERLIAASLWEGGLDNATAVVVRLQQQLSINEVGPTLAAWVEAQPRIWQMIMTEPVRLKPSLISQPETVTAYLDEQQYQGTSVASQGKKARHTKTRNNKSQKHQPAPEQAPLSIELGDTSRDKS